MMVLDSCNQHFLLVQPLDEEKDQFQMEPIV
ncbi:MAG: hypothetical protein PWP59_1045 [Sphaerochaeta sp.]|jgi:hypothetical protein|nr:hypothetical protein [Sphaerochaeta sp.]